VAASTLYRQGLKAAAGEPLDSEELARAVTLLESLPPPAATGH